MGNKMCVGRRRVPAERFTRPQRLLRQPPDVDYKKLRRLILTRKLAPCFDAVDDPGEIDGADLEECPICFLYYPSLNRSRCCGKGICTECFLQMKPSPADQRIKCPFCKNSCYAVEYHGARTQEERAIEQAEEQRVLEAKMRIQSEAQIKGEFRPDGQPWTIFEILCSLPDSLGPSVEQGEGEIAQLGSSGLQQTMDADVSSHPNMLCERHEDACVDLEEIEVMEAIWQSLQDRSNLTETSSGGQGEALAESVLATSNGTLQLLHQPSELQVQLHS